MRIHDEEHAVDGAQNPFHLRAEIGVPRRINNIDFAIAIFDRCVFRVDRNAALFFLITGIHHKLTHGFMSSERAALFEERVNQCGFTVVNVSDDGDVSDCHKDASPGALAALSSH